EMDFEDLAPPSEIANHLEYVFPHFLAAFRPGSHAECQPPMLAVSRNLLSPAIAVVMSKELSDAIHFGKRRIVRMQGQLHPSFLGNRQDCFEEVCVIGPNLFGRVFALELLLLNLLSKVIRTELSREIAAPFDLVCCVGIRRMEIVR